MTLPAPNPALVQKLAMANRILYQQGIVDGFGHISVRHDQSNAHFLLSCNRAPGLVRPQDILVYDLQGEPVSPSGQRSYLERFIHSEIYKARPDVMSVVHSHSPGVIPLGATGHRLKPVFHMSGFLGGGSALFDLVAAQLRPALSRPVRGILRSGCYVTHDHGHYQRLVHQVAQRCSCVDELQPALEVWTTVQSQPEPGLALLTGGRRDLSFDIEMPRPLALARAGRLQALPDDGSWRIKGLNDQHAHLRFDELSTLQPQVGDLVALGISHPCTTFDKWHWMPVVDDDYRVIDAVTMQF